MYDELFLAKLLSSNFPPTSEIDNSFDFLSLHRTKLDDPVRVSTEFPPILVTQIQNKTFVSNFILEVAKPFQSLPRSSSNCWSHRRA